MRFPLEGQWSGREKCTLPLLRLTSAFLRKGANPSTMVSTSRTPPSRKRSRMTLRADGLRAVVLRAVFFAMATSLRLRHHHSTIISPRAAGRGRHVATTECRLEAELRAKPCLDPFLKETKQAFALHETISCVYWQKTEWPLGLDQKVPPLVAQADWNCPTKTTQSIGRAEAVGATAIRMPPAASIETASIMRRGRGG
jgi:hypothetical protein